MSYTVNGFLDKNRDVMQDMFFEYLSKSEQPFVRDITRFQDMLTIERKVIMGNKLRRNDSIMMGRSSRNSRSSSSSLDEGMRTNKSKPTVGDAFRRQLGALVEVLDNTTPWYVRCIKPNAFKQPGKWNDELVVTQLKYSGMLDIVRIRKEVRMFGGGRERGGERRKLRGRGGLEVNAVEDHIILNCPTLFPSPSRASLCMCRTRRL